MIAIHLINRLPSRKIGLKSPIKVIEKHFPTIQLRSGLILQVFGCVRYVYAHNILVDKLSVKAVKVVFVGNSNTHNGYCYYHPSSRKSL